MIIARGREREGSRSNENESKKNNKTKKTPSEMSPQINIINKTYTIWWLLFRVVHSQIHMAGMFEKLKWTKSETTAK